MIPIINEITEYAGQIQELKRKPPGEDRFTALSACKRGWSNFVNQLMELPVARAA
jgi:hypothetical protein